jgi:hypothetical protein
MSGFARLNEVPSGKRSRELDHRKRVRQRPLETNTNGSFAKNFQSNKEEQIMNKATSTLLAAVAALALSGGAYAQNNTLATPSTVSPVAARTTNDYGTPGGTNSQSGTGSQTSSAQSTSNSSTPTTSAYGVNNTLATPSTASPVK